MTRITRVPRNLQASAPRSPAPSPAKAASTDSAWPEIPVTPGTLLVGFIALSTIAQFVTNGIGSFNFSQKVSAAGTCLPFEMASAEIAKPVPAIDTSDLQTVRNMNEANRNRTAMTEAIAMCPADGTCQGRDLKEFANKFYPYWLGRTDRLFFESKSFGQAGVDRVVEDYGTFEDNDIVNHIHAMATNGHFDFKAGGGNSRFDRGAFAFQIFAKHGPKSLVPCGSTQAPKAVAAK